MIILINIIRKILNFPLYIFITLGSIYSKIIRFLDFKNHDTYWEENLQREISKRKSKKIFLDKKIFLRFYTPTMISSFRAKSFFTKEPDTLKWLDNYGSRNRILYDIGANVGSYSIYFSKKFNATSYVFEPSFLNLNLIQNNLILNNLEKKVKIIPNAVYSKKGISTLFQLRRVAGDAVTTFRDNKVFQSMLKSSNKKNSPSTNQILGLSIDELVAHKIIEKPNLIKIDVDGNEIEVLKGSEKTLRSKRKITILVEIGKSNYSLVSNFLKKRMFKIVSSERNNYIWENNFN